MTQKSKKKGYLIRFNAEKATYPERCPVCGEPATDLGTIVSSGSKGGDKVERDWYAPRSFGRVKFGIRPSRGPGSASVKMLQIPACDIHAYSVEERDRIKGICVLIFGISILGFIFVSLQILFRFIQGVSSPLWAYLLLALAAILILGSFKGLGPSNLGKVIRIVDFSEEGSMVTLGIRNESYAEEFIRSNPHATVLESPQNI